MEPNFEAQREAILAALPPKDREGVERIDQFIRESVPEMEPLIMGSSLAYGPVTFRHPNGKVGRTARLMVKQNKNSLSIHVTAPISGECLVTPRKAEMPKASIGLGCIRVKHLEDLNFDVLREILRDSLNASWGN